MEDHRLGLTVAFGRFSGDCEKTLSRTLSISRGRVEATPEPPGRKANSACFDGVRNRIEQSPDAAGGGESVVGRRCRERVAVRRIPPLTSACDQTWQLVFETAGVARLLGRRME